MTKAIKLAICMDHSTAHLMEFNTETFKSNVIDSNAAHANNNHSSTSNENLMHNKEQHNQSEYYKKLADSIKNYTEVLLFGPTDAKSELYNILKADHNFEKIKIEVKQTDKMTDNQQHAYVKEHFSGMRW